jgi:BirA family transcriptional regulator, biotin operon repressor / biotin---[acetyl-CoA-carboxylase] ligase
MNERDLLIRLILGPASGAELARDSGQTRAALWKRIAALRAAGIAIGARPGRGYALERPLELLDAHLIRAALPPSLRAGVAALEVAWSLDSTNSELLRRPVPVAGADVLLAERQTGGRGRRGRDWTSPLAANLYLSLARMFSGGLARLPGLSLVAGIASAEALHALGFDAVRLKWPNDLVVADDDGLRKLGGLLVEGGGEHAGPVRAVLGLGLNIDMPPAFAAAITQPWIDLATLGNARLGNARTGDARLAHSSRDGAVPSRNQVAAMLLAHWLPALEQFDALGLAPFLPRYARLDALAGRGVMLHGDAGTRVGHALGLAADGALRVQVDGIEHHVHSGEISVRAT